MKSSCSLLVMAALVLGSPVAVQAQALAGGPEITGRQRVYQNPAGTLASQSDTQSSPN